MSSCLSTSGPDLTIDEVEIPDEIDFNYHVKPILADKCFTCHGPDLNKLKADLRLDVEDIAKGPLKSDHRQKAIDSGRLKSSMLYRRISNTNPDEVMPPRESGLSLNSTEIAILSKWILEGAEYKTHWSLTPPQKDWQDIETLRKQSHPIDYFIDQKLTDHGLTRQPEADTEILIRRLYLDLTGLPPSVEQINSFINDPDPNAYERLVDDLLNTSAYGEKMAVHWMDLARYADTHGYQSDRFRDVSPWRDWIIEAFNDNLSYDQFVTWQLAGDLFNRPTTEQKIATAFLRLHPQNEEGGIVEEEFRVEYAADRVNTVGTAFMGLTVGCAKCHSHKFDPISHKEYFEMFTFFNNIEEAGQISFDGAMPVPTLLLTDSYTDSIVDFINGKISDLEYEIQEVKKSKNTQFDDWYASKPFDGIGSIKIENRIGYYQLNDTRLLNTENSKQWGQMARTNSADEEPVLIKAIDDNGLLLDGDAWLDLSPVGAFNRSQSFSIGVWVNLPEELENGVIFHKGIGAALYNFKGFHLALKDNRLQMLMACTAPFNAIIVEADNPVPRGDWIHLGMTYDGSSKAEGLSLYLNGRELKTDILADNLYKDIEIGYGRGKMAGLQFGARWRGKGIGGAVIDEIEIYDRQLTKIEMLRLGDELSWQDLLAKDQASKSMIDRALYQEHFLSQLPEIQDMGNQLANLRKDLNETLEPVKELMVMHETKEPKPAFVLDRGQYDQPLDPVLPATPKAILDFDEKFPPNRLGLARWLLDENHPLTSRVAVNRYWQQFFGVGLVETSDDFGNQGALPSHPELLDYLARYFIDSGWDIKGFQKLIVMSETYRQRSKPTEKLNEFDPENRLLARGPSKRLSAEMIRDNALFASGLLDRKVGGPSVFPYQPDGLWEVNGARYPEGKDHDFYRRSLYTIWKRSVPHPTQSTFDAPGRSECTVRRQKTNTPLQALVLMNDPIFLEASAKLGEKLERGQSLNEIFASLTGRKPTSEEESVLARLFDEEYINFTTHPSKIPGWLPDDIQLSKDRSARLAAYAVVASTIMNSDAAIVMR